jgi:putative oxidoreductase
VSNGSVGASRDLQFVVDDQPTAIGVVLAWTGRVGVVAAFLFIGATKLNSDPRGEWFRIFERIGWGQWFRYFTGVVQIAGALLLLTPWTLTIGAVLLACTMVGAVIVDITVMQSVGFALLPLILLGVIAATWFAGTYGATSRR